MHRRHDSGRGAGDGGAWRPTRPATTRGKRGPARASAEDRGSVPGDSLPEEDGEANERFREDGAGVGRPSELRLDDVARSAIAGDTLRDRG